MLNDIQTSKRQDNDKTILTASQGQSSPIDNIVPSLQSEGDKAYAAWRAEYDEYCERELEEDLKTPIVNFTIYTKAPETDGNGVEKPCILTKRIYKDESGTIQKDASECRMVLGHAKTIETHFGFFKQYLNLAWTNQAFGYGICQEHKQIHVASRGLIDRYGDTGRAVTRTGDNFKYTDAPAILMIDHDPSKWAPRLQDRDEFLAALEEICPAMKSAARIITTSTSSSIKDKATGELVADSGGMHVYFPVPRGSDIERFGAVLFKRLWLANWGYIALAKNGAKLVRAIIDGAVFSPERLDFVAGAVVGDGLCQDRPAPEYRPGGYLDTTTLLDLTPDEEREFAALVDERKAAIEGKSKSVFESYVEERADELVRSRGVDRETAVRTIRASASPESADLYESFLLDFDREGVVTVREVLDDPHRFNGKTLADPIEGAAYGRGKAQFYWNNGKPVVNSFAHGGVKYFLHPFLPEEMNFEGLVAGGVPTDHESLDELGGDELDLAGNSGTVDSAATPTSDAMKEATLSARRATLRGEPMNLIARRIVKQWPWLRGHADEIAQRAFNWAKKLEPGNTIELSGITRRITSLEILNKKFGMLEAPGQQTCIIHRPDGLPVSDKDFRARIESEVVIVGVDSKGQPQCVDASRAWRQSANKHTFNRIRFTAKPVLESDYNLFTGYGCKPIEGDCSLILRHIYEVICGSDTATYEAFLSLLAWQFQNVGRPSRIITTLYSEEQQIGKGIFLEHVLVPMAGLHGFMSSNVEHGFSRFNDALRGKFIVFLDEASFAGDRKLADKLKSTAGTENMPIEGKGVPIINMPSGINLFMATNHMHSANVERIDARYWILRVSPCRKGDFQYFTALREQIENGGREAFLHYLLTRDTSNFIPQRDIPRENEMLEVNREMSLAAGHPAHWLRECIEYSALRGAVENGIDRPWMTGSEIGGSILHDAYRYWVKNIKAIHVTEVTMSAFWRFMTAMGFEKGSKSRNRTRLIPSMELCAERLRDYMAGRISLDS